VTDTHPVSDASASKPVKSGVQAATTKRRSRASNSLGEATRERIILAAERLFAERGIDSVSLREVADAAGQRNSVAIQYHFGDRDGLLTAAIAYRALETGEVRLGMLADMLAQGREPDVRGLVAAIVMPGASQLVPDNHYLGLQARYVVERGPFHIRFTNPPPVADQPEGAWNLLREAMRRKLADLPETLFDARWDMAVNTSILTLAGYQMAMARGDLVAPIDLLLADLIDVLTGALTAESTAVGAPEPGRRATVKRAKAGGSRPATGAAVAAGGGRPYGGAGSRLPVPPSGVVVIPDELSAGDSGPSK
jgi:AcrR family transcriptional regulator